MNEQPGHTRTTGSREPYPADKMRDALWQITWAKTLEQAIEQAQKALDLMSTSDTMSATDTDEPLVDCPVCGGSGFSGYGSGYDDVCGECGGQRQMPARLYTVCNNHEFDI